MTPRASSIKVQDLDRCGIVAGIIDSMGLVEQINQELGTHPQEIISWFILWLKEPYGKLWQMLRTQEKIS
jgi:hypothetical protein